MPQPEIARRCPSCGASIRDHAFFCPQCGKDLAQPDFSQTLPIVPARDRQDAAAPAADREAPSAVGRDTLADTPRLPPTDRHVPPKPTNQTPAGQTARGAVGARLQRAGTLARDVEGDVMQRARKMRELSGVVLDEAGYDPSLRFVLVAAALFVLFLVIVLLNRFIT